MIKVLGDRVLVALPPREDEMVSAGGIVLVKDPDRFQTPTRGIVVALGEKTGAVDLDDVRAVLAEWLDPLCPKITTATAAFNLQYISPFEARVHVAQLIASMDPAPFDVQLGDCVIFPRSAGEEIHDGEIDYVILREAEILGVVEPKSEAA